MNTHQLSEQSICAYIESLRAEERAPGTVSKYRRDLEEFALWLEGRSVGPHTAADWKQALLAAGLAPVTVNSKLSALNGFFRFAGWPECRVKFLRLQRRLFRDPSRELSRKEYDRLLSAARTAGKRRLELLMEAICSTGIRVSEVPYLTVQAARSGRTDVCLKGKVRTVLLPGRLCRKLLKYAKAEHITSGEIFRTGAGKPLSRRQIWREMKGLCAAAGVLPSKVFPHNLRHLFAAAFYQAGRDIVKLAGVLGHSSIETTRIYLLASGAEHRRILEGLHLVS